MTSAADVNTVTKIDGSLRTRMAVNARDPGVWSNYAVVIGLVAVVVIFALLTPDFLTGANVNDVLVAAAILAVLAVGQAFVIVTGGIDLSVGSNLPWSAVVFGLAFTHGWTEGVACLAAIAAGGAVGLLNGLIIAKVRISDFIVTLGTLGIMQGVALVVTGGQAFSVETHFLQRLNLGSLGPFRYFVLVALAVAVVGHLLLFRTQYGTHLLATGGNRQAARSMGVKVDRVRISAYVISGLLAGIGGILLVSLTGSSDPTLQTDQLLSSIAAVVLGGAVLSGGRGSIAGAVAGSVLLTTLLNGFTLLQVSSYYQPIAVGLVVVASATLSRFQR